MGIPAFNFCGGIEPGGCPSYHEQYIDHLISSQMSSFEQDCLAAELEQFLGCLLHVTDC